MLSRRSQPYIIPEYSLTGDLLAYLTCGLQYRYYNRASLPPSTPVQLWFGEFIHSVLEEAYRRWQREPAMRSFPWDWAAQVREIEMEIHKRLASQGLLPPPRLFCPYKPGDGIGFCPDANHPHKLLASRRADAAINLWGPHLFPLVTEAELRLRSTRPMPDYRPGESRSEYYGVTGIADVIASVAIREASENNLILKYLLPFVDGTDGEYEVIIDYKGMRRPGLKDLRWEHHRWQILTYAWLRSRQPSSKPVKAGVIFYLNELVLSEEDLKRLKEEVEKGDTDVMPGGEDLKKIIEWRAGKGLPMLSGELKEERSIRVVPVSSAVIEESLREFDKVISQIEGSVLREKRGTPIKQCWRPLFREETCTACDFKTFCPDPNISGRYRPAVP